MDTTYTTSTTVSIILDVIGFSYFGIILLARDWFIKHLKIFLSIGIFLSMYSLVETFTFILKSIGPGIMRINGPLITLTIYWLLYKLYHRIYQTELASPMECFYGKETTFTIDSLFTFIFILLSFFLIAAIGRLDFIVWQIRINL